MWTTRFQRGGCRVLSVVYQRQPAPHTLNLTFYQGSHRSWKPENSGKSVNFMFDLLCFADAEGAVWNDRGMLGSGCRSATVGRLRHGASHRNGLCGHLKQHQ